MLLGQGVVCADNAESSTFCLFSGAGHDGGRPSARGEHIMSKETGPALQAALESLLQGLDGEEPTEAMEELERLLAAPPESAEELAGMMEAVRAVVAQATELAGAPLKELSGNLSEAEIQAIGDGLSEIVPGPFSALREALTDPEVFLSGLTAAVDKAVAEPEEWQAIASTYEYASKLALEGDTDTALKMAMAARLRAVEVEPDFAHRGTLTIGFVHEQSGDSAAAIQAYETAFRDTSTNRDLSGIAGRAAVGLIRLLRGGFNEERIDEYLTYARSAAVRDADRSLLISVTLLASDLAAAAGNLDKAVRHLVEGRAQIEGMGEDDQPLVSALEGLAQRCGEDRINGAFDAIEAEL